MKKEEREYVLQRSLLTGFIGGIFWSFIGIVIYYFNFSEVSPKAIILKSWTSAKWTNKWWLGDIATILLLGLLSILIAVVYYFFLKRIHSLWAGVIYGIALWGLFFLFIYPLFPHVKPFNELNKDTIFSTICLFLLYGAFVGYSISYDYYDMQMDAKRKKES